MSNQVERESSGVALAAALQAFEDVLTERAYKATTKLYLRICEQLIAYVARERIDVGSLGEGHLETFLRSAPARRRLLQRGGELRQQSWRRPLRLFLQELRRSGLACPVLSSAQSAHPIVADFSAFLASHRGLSAATIERYTACVGRLLDSTGLRTEAAMRDLSVAQVDRFLIAAAQRRARSTVNTICNGVRAFLRYAHVCGLRSTDLSPEVTLPRIYALERLPRFLDWSDIERTLASVDRTTLLGCRDYAILVLLARCGLRGGEVAALELADVDLRHDTIRLGRRKSNTTEHVPLVPVVGEALVAYVCRRPRVPFATLFLKVLAPIGPLSRASIGQVVKGHLKRAGIQAPHWGCHTLRHSFAVRLLRQGFPLKTIGDALGHHHPDSTFIYAKAAVDDLRAVCLGLERVLP